MKNEFSCRILVTLLDRTTSEGGEIGRQQNRAVCLVY